MLTRPAIRSPNAARRRPAALSWVPTAVPILVLTKLTPIDWWSIATDASCAGRQRAATVS